MAEGPWAALVRAAAHDCLTVRMSNVGDAQPRRGKPASQSNHSSPLELPAQTPLQLPQSRKEAGHADDASSGVVTRNRRQRQADEEQRQAARIEYQPALMTPFESRAKASVRRVVMNRRVATICRRRATCSALPDPLIAVRSPLRGTSGPGAADPKRHSGCP